MLSKEKWWQWINRHEPGLRELSAEELDEITHFLFLWMIFEARALHTHACAVRISRAAKRWAKAGLLDSNPFGEHLAYFRNRYVKNGELTRRFRGLNFRDNDKPHLVRTVLRGKESIPEDVTAAVLVIVYRLRNNLFHGVKWSYELRKHFENFTCANKVLMHAIERTTRGERLGSRATGHWRQIGQSALVIWRRPVLGPPWRRGRRVRKHDCPNARTRSADRAAAPVP